MSHVDEGTLHALVDNQLVPAERESVEAHLATCGECARQFAEATAMARQVHGLLGALDEQPAPLVVTREPASVRRDAATPVRAAALASINVTPTQRRMRTLRRVALAASVLAVAGISYRVGVNRTTTAAMDEKVLARPASSRILATPPSASIVEAAPEAIALPSAPTVRLAPRGGPRAEQELAAPIVSPAPAAPIAAPLPAPVAAVPRALGGVVLQEQPKMQAASPEVAAADAADRAARAVGASAAASDAATSARRSEPTSRRAPSQVVVTGVASNAAPAQMADQASASELTGYRSIDEPLRALAKRRRYVATDGLSLLLVITPVANDISKPTAKASEYAVTAEKGLSVVRWLRDGRAYELTGALPPDSLMRLATQLK